MLALLNGVTVGLALAIPLGLIAILLVTISARHGWRVGVAGGLGAATVDGIYATLAVVAGTVIAPWIEAAGGWLRWTSVALLVGVAVVLARPLWSRRAATSGDDAAIEEPRRLTRGRAFVLLVGLTAANPATVVYFAALIAGGGTGPLDSAWDSALWVLGVFLASATWASLIAIAGARLGRWVRSPRGRRWTAAIGALLVLFLAAKVAFGF